MNKKVILAMLIPFLFVGISGCAPLFLMTVGGVGVYAVSKDTIQGDMDTQYEALWDAAIKVARIRGTILQQDFNRGYIEIDAKPNNIKIQFIRVTAATTKLKVSARKYKKVFPNIEIAQDVFVKITEEANRAN
jgi:hypothetical protein